MRTGIFGGTFNPIHIAHLRIAEEAREACGLDRVIFMPAALPPHKRVEEDVPFADRLAMVRAATADHPAFAVSDLEFRRQGKSYSVHTLEILRERHPGDDFFFIIGMDSYRDLASWKEYRRLFDLANLVVLSRPGADCERPRELLPVAIRDQFCYDSRSNQLLYEGGNRVIFLEEILLDISSTDIRQRLAEGRSVRYLIPPAVAGYLQRRGFYLPRKRS